MNERKGTCVGSRGARALGRPPRCCPGLNASLQGPKEPSGSMEEITDPDPSCVNEEVIPSRSGRQ